MTQILLNNAFEAWLSAIHYCDDIIQGKCSLYYQKGFVSSLHNAVELYFKQMLLDESDHQVANIRVRDENDAKLQLDFFRSKNLNTFFIELSKDESKKFKTIDFTNLIEKTDKLLENCFNDKTKIKKTLKLLQELRNDETHFYVSHNGFLSEENFITLYEFMIDFYKLLNSWTPKNKGIEYSLLPYNVDDDSAFSFNRSPLQDFTYLMAVKNAPLVKQIKNLFKSESLGNPEANCFDIAKGIIEKHPEYEGNTFIVWTYIQLMFKFKIIKTEEIFDDENLFIQYRIVVND